MEQFWTYGPMFVRELQEHYEEPRPNFNTLSNQVHTLMEDGFLERKAYGSNYQYIPVVSRKAYSLDGFHGLVNEYFDSSYSSVVLGLVEALHHAPLAVVLPLVAVLGLGLGDGRAGCVGYQPEPYPVPHLPIGIGVPLLLVFAAGDEDCEHTYQ